MWVYFSFSANSRSFKSASRRGGVEGAAAQPLISRVVRLINRILPLHNRLMPFINRVMPWINRIMRRTKWLIQLIIQFNPFFNRSMPLVTRCNSCVTQLGMKSVYTFSFSGDCQVLTLCYPSRFTIRRQTPALCSSCTSCGSPRKVQSYLNKQSNGSLPDLQHRLPRVAAGIRSPFCILSVVVRGGRGGWRSGDWRPFTTMDSHWIALNCKLWFLSFHVLPPNGYLIAI